MRSMGSAPSRFASFFASSEKVPVVINSPLSARPTVAPTEVANRRGANYALITLALKYDVEAQYSVDLSNPLSINSAITTTPGNFNLNESRLSQD